jgi:hypothetical protein
VEVESVLALFERGGSISRRVAGRLREQVRLCCSVKRPFRSKNVLAVKQGVMHGHDSIVYRPSYKNAMGLFVPTALARVYLYFAGPSPNHLVSVHVSEEVVTVLGTPLGHPPFA